MGLNVVTAQPRGPKVDPDVQCQHCSRSEPDPDDPLREPHVFGSDTCPVFESALSELRHEQITYNVHQTNEATVPGDTDTRLLRVSRTAFMEIYGCGRSHVNSLSKAKKSTFAKRGRKTGTGRSKKITDKEMSLVEAFLGTVPYEQSHYSSDSNASGKRYFTCSRLDCWKKFMSVHDVDCYKQGVRLHFFQTYTSMSNSNTIAPTEAAYLADEAKKKLMPLIGYQSFLGIVAQFNITFGTHKVDKCTTCAALEAKISQLAAKGTGQEERQKLQEELNTHQDSAREAYSQQAQDHARGKEEKKLRVVTMDMGGAASTPQSNQGPCFFLRENAVLTDIFAGCEGCMVFMWQADAASSRVGDPLLLTP